MSLKQVFIVHRIYAKRCPIQENPFLVTLWMVKATCFCRYLRFRRVVWRGGVSHILCALEHTESETGQEVAGSKQTSGRAEGEASML
jgi:hypothetical protein